MPQDPNWKDRYPKPIEQGWKDTTIKDIHITIDSAAVDRIFWNAGLKNTYSPFPIFLIILIIVIGKFIFKNYKKSES